MQNQKLSKNTMKCALKVHLKTPQNTPEIILPICPIHWAIAMGQKIWDMLEIKAITVVRKEYHSMYVVVFQKSRLDACLNNALQ